MNERDARRILEPWLTDPINLSTEAALPHDSLGRNILLSEVTEGGRHQYPLRISWGIGRLAKYPKHMPFVTGRLPPEIANALAWYTMFKQGPGGMA